MKEIVRKFLKIVKIKETLRFKKPVIAHNLYLVLEQTTGYRNI